MSKIQDPGFMIQDSKQRLSCIVHHASRITRKVMHLASCILHLGKKGFTIIEIIMIIVVVSIAIPALLIMVGQEAKFGIESEIRVTAANVAQALLEEIKTKKWDQNSPIPPGTASTTLGPESGETSLSLFDDADDFNNLSGYGGSPCTDTVTVNDVVFTREVDVCYVSATDLKTCLGTKASCTWSGATPTDYKNITVTITAPATNWNSSVVLTTVMTNY